MGRNLRWSLIPASEDFRGLRFYPLVDQQAQTLGARSCAIRTRRFTSLNCYNLQF
jgi:hypothetical protein